MPIRATTLAMLLFAVAIPAGAKTPPQTPAELEVLQAAIGVWDADIEVWPEGPDSPSVRFQGVETNRAYGAYWIASDLDCVIDGQTMRVHSIVGYDLDEGKLVGRVIDDGPYAATLTGVYDQASKTVHWTTAAKAPNGEPIVQKTTVTQMSPDERLLELSVPDGAPDAFRKCMRIRFVRRSPPADESE